MLAARQDKKAGGRGGEAERPPEEEAKDVVAPPLQPDVQTLLYLHVASRAFPSAEKALDQQTSRNVVKATRYSTASANADRFVEKLVSSFTEERQLMHGDLNNLKKISVDVHGQVRRNREHFAERMAAQQKEHADELEKLRGLLQTLQTDSREALDWRNTVSGQTSEVNALKTRIEKLKEQQEKEIQELQAEHDQERRHLRDMLVRKLRRVRDAMSSTTDDNDAGDGVAVTDLPNSTSAAKLNERLSRAVTMYEREAKSIGETIDQATVACKESGEQLRHLQSFNAKLVQRNAAHAKALAMLNEQRKSLRMALKSASAQQDIRGKEHRRAIQQTVRTQGDVVAELRSELEDAIKEYESSRRELHALQQHHLLREKELHSAEQFFVKALDTAQVARRQRDPAAPMTMEPIVALNLADPVDVAAFCVSVVQRRP